MRTWEESKKVFSILTEEQKNKIDSAIKIGNSIEIHPSKDGVKIYEVKKRTIK